MRHPAAPIRVVLAEDHALVRAGLRALLSGMTGVEVVAEAADGRDALEIIGTELPDVAILDITMPGLSGIQVLTQVRLEHPSVQVIVVSMHDNEEYVRKALRAGATGYLLKDSSPAELELALRAVVSGGTYLSPAVSRHIVTDFIQRPRDDGSALDGLTPRQHEILQLIAEGRTNQEMAGLLSLSVKTIETHRLRLMERLDIHDIAGLVRYAIRSGLIPSDR